MKVQWKVLLIFRGVQIWYISLLLGGCKQSNDPPEVISTPTQKHRWSLVSQKIIKNHERPVWFDVDCNSEPCFVETWACETQQHNAFWSDSKYHWTESIVFKTRWQSINGVLASCMGHPYSVPVATDPAGKRQLLEQKSWILHLSGSNLCHLGGEIVISTTTEALDLKKLTVDEILWNEGGIELARKYWLQSIEGKDDEAGPSD
jgi:hypothetical protein